MVRYTVILLALSLVVACNVTPTPQATGEMPELIALEGYHAQDASGQFSSRVEGVMVESRTGNIQYIIIEIPTSAFAIDRSTAALVGKEYILVPWRLVTIDSHDSSLVMNVGSNELEHSPHFSSIPTGLTSERARQLDTYWSAILK
jgi:sporulation protein YlmC with PRC-barrel domain